MDMNFLAGLVVSPVLMAVGYFYKSSVKSKNNKKHVLYILLEIWHLMSQYKFKNIEHEMTRLLGQVYEENSIKVTEEELKLASKIVTPIVVEVIKKPLIIELSEYQAEYKAAIISLTPDDPIFAYQINRASNLSEVFDGLDTYFEEMTKSAEDVGDNDISLISEVKNNMSDYFSEDIVRDLERDIRKVAYKISLQSYYRVRKLLLKGRKRMSLTLPEECSEMIKEQMKPFIQEHRDGSGVN